MKFHSAQRFKINFFDNVGLMRCVLDTGTKFSTIYIHMHLFRFCGKNKKIYTCVKNVPQNKMLQLHKNNKFKFSFNV